MHTPTTLDVDAILAYHRAVFGDARMMADDDSGDDTSSGDGDAQNDTRGGDAGRADDSRDNDRDEELREAGKRALDEERRARRDATKTAKAEKERADALAAKLAEYERAQMTDQERIAAERDDLRKQLEERDAQLRARELELVRREVAEEKGIPARMARRLAGSTREEIEADADLFLKDMPEQPRPKYVDPTAGTSSQGGPPASMADGIAAYIQERTKRSRG